MVTHMTIEAAGQNESAVGWKCNEHCAGVPRKKENAELPLEGLWDAGCRLEVAGCMRTCAPKPREL